jgi:hypothetical protein
VNWRDKYRRRDKNRAAVIPSEEFIGLLDSSEDCPSGYFLIGDEERGYSIHLWYRGRGLYTMRSGNNAYCFAITEYLLANGALRFSSSKEAEEFARARGWSGSSDR